MYTAASAARRIGARRKNGRDGGLPKKKIPPNSTSGLLKKPLSGGENAGQKQGTAENAKKAFTKI